MRGRKSSSPLAPVSAEIVNSCTSATPVLAMTRLVRVYARKVRSEARWSRATEPEFSRVRVTSGRVEKAEARGEVRWSIVVLRGAEARFKREDSLEGSDGAGAAVGVVEVEVGWIRGVSEGEG